MSSVEDGRIAKMAKSSGCIDGEGLDVAMLLEIESAADLRARNDADKDDFNDKVDFLGGLLRKGRSDVAVVSDGETWDSS